VGRERNGTALPPYRQILNQNQLVAVLKNEGYNVTVAEFAGLSVAQQVIENIFRGWPQWVSLSRVLRRLQESMSCIMFISSMMEIISRRDQRGTYPDGQI
jgi:hypothetical protein